MVKFGHTKAYIPVFHVFPHLIAISASSKNFSHHNFLIILRNHSDLITFSAYFFAEIIGYIIYFLVRGFFAAGQFAVGQFTVKKS